MKSVPIYDQDCKLLLETLEMLKGKDLLEIYRETGVPYFWMRALVTRRLKIPTVNRITFLHDYLTEKEANSNP